MNAGDNAERLTQAAIELALTVHDEDRDAIAARLAGIKPADIPGVLVCLAALVDVDRPVTDLLAWVTWDEDGKPTQPRRRKIDVPARVRRGHAAYVRGERTPKIIEDERTYQRQRARRRRAVA